MTFFKLARGAFADERVAIMIFAAPSDVLHIATFLRFCAMCDVHSHPFPVKSTVHWQGTGGFDLHCNLICQ